MSVHKLKAVDSHTGGEPTRVVIEGGPDLGVGTLAERAEAFRDRHDSFRRAVVNEPRGSEVLVGALLCEPEDKSCLTGVLFFNNVGYLKMCGHGTIGVIETLAHLKKALPGTHRIETPVGIVSATLHENGEVSVQNVPSYRFAEKIPLEVEGFGVLHGDIAWGGNWFFLIEDHHQVLEFSNVKRLTEFCCRVRAALKINEITGKDGQQIDHIELFAPALSSIANSRNFVLCPGEAYDRSPCGTGTSAKLACLFADGKLKVGEIWRQESIIGSVFEGSVQLIGGAIIPTIRGRAYVTAETTQILNSEDPYCWGI